ncbi:MAG: polymorphic toxin-type HINT domain-containing protein [Acidimicrobiales bacterium]
MGRERARVRLASVLLVVALGALLGLIQARTAVAGTPSSASPTYSYDAAFNNELASPVEVPRVADRHPPAEAQRAASLGSRPSQIGLVVAAEAGSGAAAEGESGLASELAGACHSFAPATLVVLADGSTKPISEVTVGDRVRTTDPATGKTVVRGVTALHRNHDTDMADLVVRDGDGHESTVHTTQHHRFWDDTRHGWVEAAALTGGDRLHTGDGGAATVESVDAFAGLQWMYDLTVEDVHTYYVVAGDNPVLVHNCNIVQDVIGETQAGSGNITSGRVLTADEALATGEEFVGPGYTELGRPGSGVFRSADELRQFRMDPRSLEGLHPPGGPHVHFEMFNLGDRLPFVNNHVPFL